jgi:hypothetical protein
MMASKATQWKEGHKRVNVEKERNGVKEGQPQYPDNEGGGGGGSP